jgi:hypothetical protein
MAKVSFVIRIVGTIGNATSLKSLATSETTIDPQICTGDISS